MAHRFVIADVFTEKAFGGNQLAVFPDARGISDRAMQAIAREFNFSETTFVLPPQDARHRCNVRIFTPSRELGFAGHPTVGTAAVLAHLGLLEPKDGMASIVFEEKAGPVSLEVHVGRIPIFATFAVERAVEVGAAPLPRGAVAAVLSLPEDAVLETWFASLGLPFCFAHLADQAAVDRAAIDGAAWSTHLAHAWAPDIFLFAGSLQPGSRLYARMFAPGVGIVEDPATGSASATLAGTLAARTPEREGTLVWTIDQGVAMGRPSVIEASAEKREGGVLRAMVGGPTVIVAEGEMTVPAAPAALR
jgi:trans-2,3-dihydro-3-hydroxyanthranilate isomerase